MILDTHALLWLRQDDRRLGRRARGAVERSWADEGLAISAVTFWELAMLHDKGRLQFSVALESWRRDLLGEGFSELPVDGVIGIRAGGLSGLPADPADRLIVATAMEGHRLVTADRHILDWPGPVERLDATE